MKIKTCTPFSLIKMYFFNEDPSFRIKKLKEKLQENYFKS